MAATYALASAGTYTDSRTGIPAHFAAGTYPLDLAVIYGMPGAAAPTVYDPLDTQIDDPADGDVLTFNAESGLWEARAASGGGGGVATIHNWFPDGAVSDAALIDTENTYDAEFCWMQNGGAETLSFSEGTAEDGGNEVEVACPGEGWNEGVVVADYANTYGCAEIPAGHHRLSVTLRTPTWSPIVDFQTQTTDPALYVRTSVVGTASNRSQRVIVEVLTTTVGYVGLRVIINPDNYPIDQQVTPPSGSLFLSDLMVTEGDSLIFRDGDSPGWSWSGTAHASASSGPQP